MKTGILSIGPALFVLAFCGTSLADTIDFGQFGAPGASLANSLTGVTTAGVDFTITGPGFGFKRVTAGSQSDLDRWYPSAFASGTPLLWDAASDNPADYGPGPVTIDFATPISSISMMAAEADLFGPFTATLTAYDGASLLGTSSYSASGVSSPGSIPSFSFAAPAITSIVIDTTNDGGGFALGETPEPATWAMMAIGFAGLGFLGYRSRKAVTISA